MPAAKYIPSPQAERRIVESTVTAMLACGLMTPYDGGLPEATAGLGEKGIKVWIVQNGNDYWVFLRIDHPKLARRGKGGKGNSWQAAIDDALGKSWWVRQYE